MTQRIFFGHGQKNVVRKLIYSFISFCVLIFFCFLTGSILIFYGSILEVILIFLEGVQKKRIKIKWRGGRVFFLTCPKINFTRWRRHTDIQTDRQTDMVTLRPTRPSGTELVKRKLLLRFLRLKGWKFVRLWI